MSFGKDNYVSKSFQRDYAVLHPDADFSKDGKGVFTDSATQLAFKAFERAFNYAHTMARQQIDTVSKEKATSKVYIVSKATDKGDFTFIRKPYQHRTFDSAMLDAEEKYNAHAKPFHVFACVGSVTDKTQRARKPWTTQQTTPEAPSETTEKEHPVTS